LGVGQVCSFANRPNWFVRLWPDRISGPIEPHTATHPYRKLAIFGNPLIALTMLRHDYTAGLFVPPELLLAESEDGPGCNITYVLPSSLIAVEENPQLLAAALALDAKIEAFVTSAVMS
jgi:hypothetical protein